MKTYSTTEYAASLLIDFFGFRDRNAAPQLLREDDRDRALSKSLGMSSLFGILSLYFLRN